MTVNLRKVFREHCGPGAQYVGSTIGNRDGHRVVRMTFKMVPEGRLFNLDGVIHPPGRDDEVRAAVEKIAVIARDVRQHLEAKPCPN